MYPNGIHSTCDTGAGIGFKLTPFGEGKEVKASKTILAKFSD